MERARTSSGRQWYYFGCIGDCGHYLWNERLSRCSSQNDLVENKLGRFDGSLCGQESDGLYIANLARLGNVGYSALAFWDRTVDKRPGSNSIFFAPDLIHHPRALMTVALKKFSSVARRLPEIDVSRAVAQHEAIVGPYRDQSLAAVA